MGSYGRKDDPPSPDSGVAYLPAALMCILLDVLMDGDYRAPNPDVTSPAPLQSRPHALTPVLADDK